ncbi:hypothetical protein ACNQR7_30885 [Mycolicibacterium senegalense]|uniref:hypothetical protein n=1 Tax=Mycolicibacterium senegalense TaxID=1796 RepID=UPI003AAF86C2
MNAHGTPQLSAVIGEDSGGEPVLVVLTEQRPHARWIGTLGTGKSSQLRLVVEQLARQVPATPGRLRMVLFDHRGMDKTFSGLDELDGVVVVHPDSTWKPAGHNTDAAIERLRDELDWRRTHPTAAMGPLVIIIDDADHEWRRDSPLVDLIVGESEAEPGAKFMYPRITPPNGIHILLTSTELENFYEDPEIPERARLRAAESFTTVMLPLGPNDLYRCAAQLASLESVCGNTLGAVVADWRRLDWMGPHRFGKPREAFRITSNGAVRFRVAQPADRHGATARPSCH